jgi:hypothetical protein
LHMCIDTWTPGQVDTCPIETVESSKMTEGTN